MSNIEFEFDPGLPAYSRVNGVRLGGKAIELEKEYTVVTRDYMARGKDGFSSLMTEPEGGTAKELVSEENGILLSMLLRQYFMSLRVLRRWRLWSTNMNSHWNGVKKSVHSKHPVMEAKPANPGTQKLLPTQRAPVTNGDKDGVESDSESDISEQEVSCDDRRPPPDEREQQMIKRVARKWWRLTGLPGRPGLCSNIGEDEVRIDWTRVCKPLVGYCQTP